MKKLIAIAALALTCSPVYAAHPMPLKTIVEGLQAPDGSGQYMYTLGLVNGISYGAPARAGLPESICWSVTETADDARSKVRQVLTQVLLDHPDYADQDGLLAMETAEEGLFPCK